MKIVMIHGQNHQGSTCMAARQLAEKVGGETKEFFLPRDFDKPCRGCYTCFQTELSKCPHYRELEPLEQAILEADLLIFDSPVYVYHATGQMMSFLDHFGTWWVVHRPRTEMSRKQAVAISTAAGGGMKSTCRDMADSLEMWGVRGVYRLGVGVQAAKPTEIPERIQKSIDKKTDALARKIRSNAGKRGYNTRAKLWFSLMRMAHKHLPPAEPDYGYWETQGWHGKGRPWKKGRTQKMDIRDILCAKDVKSSYQLFVQLEQQAGEDPALFREYPLYLEMLRSGSSYIRVRGFRMLCAAAKWDTEGVIRENLPQILGQLRDDKPTAVRQCLAALPKLVTCRPELTALVCQAVSELDFSRYGDSMRPLIYRDAEAFLKRYQ